MLTGAEAEGSDIPAAVPMQDLTPQVPEAAEGAPEPMEEAVEEAAVATGEEEATVPPEAALEVVVRSPEIQDAEPIRSTPMTESATSSRGGVELLADDLVDPATVARHLEAVRQAEQWMKESDLWVQLDEESVWRKEGFFRCIRQKNPRSAICFRSAREQLS
jgi:hypothetical protein